MPPIRQLAKLFQALSHRDLESAQQLAAEIAEAEEKKGHPSAAQTLRGALHSNGIRKSRPIEPISGTLTNGNFLDFALSRSAATTQLKDAMLRPATRKTLETVITETQNGAYLWSKGIRRRAKLLFVGPPGCGKSFTAQAIANELDLPLFIVRFDAVIGAYLGQTAIHLREIFRFVSGSPCVLLFDEIDALGKQRGSLLDVGELDRIVIALMQELEFLQTSGVVIATSNLPKNLDRALWRRFDLVLQFPTPSKTELETYGARISAKFGLKPSQVTQRHIATAKTFADTEKLVEAEARRVALEKVLKQ
jgi:SpoVK/Ycf46/Vps4 family AAA+-type ATPase